MTHDEKRERRTLVSLKDRGSDTAALVEQRQGWNLEMDQIVAAEAAVASQLLAQDSSMTRDAALRAAAEIVERRGVHGWVKAARKDGAK